MEGWILWNGWLGNWNSSNFSPPKLKKIGMVMEVFSITNSSNHPSEL